MIYLKIYLLLCTAWGIFAIYKVRQMGGYLGKLFLPQVQTFLTNFILMPYCVYYAIKHKKI